MSKKNKTANCVFPTSNLANLFSRKTRKKAKNAGEREGGARSGARPGFGQQTRRGEGGRGMGRSGSSKSRLHDVRKRGEPGKDVHERVAPPYREQPLTIQGNLPLAGEGVHRRGLEARKSRDRTTHPPKGVPLKGLTIRL